MPTNYPATQFLGTPQTVINTTSNITASNFSGSPAAVYDATADAVVPNARYAKVVAVFPAWSGPPAAGSVIDLYGLPQDVDSTNDDTDAPATTVVGGARLLGSFVLANQNALQRRTIIVDLLGYLKMNIYLRNGTAVQITNNGGTNCTVIMTPLAEGVTV